MREELYYEEKDDNKPQKPPLSKKTKRAITVAVCIALGLLIATGIIAAVSFMVTGSSSPEEAVADYQKAALLYDIDGMIKYSSQYNKVVLYGNRETSDRLLRPYLEKGYEGYTSPYTEAQIDFKLVSVREYEEGSSRYDEMAKKYNEKVENGSNDISKIAVVRMNVITGKSDITRDYLAVKIGMRWYFAFAIGAVK